MVCYIKWKVSLDKNAYIKTQMEYCKDLLNTQNDEKGSTGKIVGFQKMVKHQIR
jgi:hypothetical protein